MKQVVTIGPDGTISGLQHKKGQGFDLRALGKAQIKRASEVLWSEPYQGWYVEMRGGAGRYSGWPLSRDLMRLAGDPEVPPHTTGLIPANGEPPQPSALTLLFEEYEDAVKAEIAVLDALRLKGLLTP